MRDSWKAFSSLRRLGMGVGFALLPLTASASEVDSLTSEYGSLLGALHTSSAMAFFCKSVTVDERPVRARLRDIEKALWKAGLRGREVNEFKTSAQPAATLPTLSADQNGKKSSCKAANAEMAKGTLAGQMLKVN